MTLLGRTRALPTLLAAVALGCSESLPSRSAERMLGAPASLGNGTAEAYVEVDASGAPTAIGVAFSEGALEALPQGHSDGHRCYDADADGSIDDANECSGWHELVLPLPSEAARRPDVPFEWALVNWNAHGHIPPGVWDVPHFDVHFYIERVERIFSLQRGTCGPEFLRCDQFERATLPLPPNYMPPDYQDVGAAAPAMGNHLIDPTAPEFHGEPFQRHWIFGTYDGRVIFYEEMVAADYLRRGPDSCYDIKSPPAVGLSGYYPTRSCVRHDESAGLFTVSMEGFVMREASPPLPVPAADAGG